MIYLTWTEWMTLTAIQSGNKNCNALVNLEAVDELLMLGVVRPGPGGLQAVPGKRVMIAVAEGLEERKPTCQ